MAVKTAGGVVCNVEDKCVVGSGLGSCFVSVDAFAVLAPVGSTDTGTDVDFIIVLNGSARGSVQPSHGHYTYPPASPESAVSAIDIVGRSPAAHWNLCWTSPMFLGNIRPWGGTDRRDLLRLARVQEDYCYYVNGLCWIWASPCSGAPLCSQMSALSTYDWFCPLGLRYANQSEFDAATPTLYANKRAFHNKCAASRLDPRHNHCDYSNDFVRVENNSYDELILVCNGFPVHPTPNPTFWPSPYPTPYPTSSPTPFPTPYPTPYPTPSPTTSPLPYVTPSPTRFPTSSPTPVPTASPTAQVTGASAAGGAAQATGDPHLANVLGQRFDLHKEGLHTLVRIPRGADRGAAFLSVEAEARQLGVACADMYFQSVNLTGTWVGSQGRAFRAGHVANKESQRWLRYGKVELKVVQGHTKSGIVYLNLFVRHLKSAGYPVGGILGLDDHTAAASPSQKCRKRISLLAIDRPVLSTENASSAAADLE